MSSPKNKSRPPTLVELQVMASNQAVGRLLDTMNEEMVKARMSLSQKLAKSAGLLAISKSRPAPKPTPDPTGSTPYLRYKKHLVRKLFREFQQVVNQQDVTPSEPEPSQHPREPDREERRMLAEAWLREDAPNRP